MLRFLDNQYFLAVGLMIVVLGDLFIPFLLAPFYPGYNHRMMAMSVLGGTMSPVRWIYNGWLISAGVLFFILAVGLYRFFMGVSSTLSVALLVTTGCFSIGAMIIAGMFSVEEQKETLTKAAHIHGICAALGFMTLMFVPLIMALLHRKTNDLSAFWLYLICFVLAVITFVIFIMGDKERFRDTVIGYEGVWQRLSLLFMYIPYFHFAVRILLKH